MPSMQLDIVTPEKRILSEMVDEVTAPGILGEFGIMAMHTPFLTTLGIGALAYKIGHKTKKYVINGGYAEVSQDKIIILTETCEDADSIDVKRARKAFQESQKVLLDLDASSAEYKKHWDRAKRAKARIEVSESAFL